MAFFSKRNVASAKERSRSAFIALRLYCCVCFGVNATPLLVTASIRFFNAFRVLGCLYCVKRSSSFMAMDCFLCCRSEDSCLLGLDPRALLPPASCWANSEPPVGDRSSEDPVKNEPSMTNGVSFILLCLLSPREKRSVNCHCLQQHERQIRPDFQSHVFNYVWVLTGLRGTYTHRLRDTGAATARALLLNKVGSGVSQ